MAAILYLSYDGLTDPLGPSQVLAYLKPLAAMGHRIGLVTFEKPERSPAEREAMALECRGAGIEWHPQRYTKWPPVVSTLKDLTQMRRVALQLHARKPFEVVHCRSYPPALVGQAVQKRGAKLLFDMRGFWADERAEGGLWNLDKPLFAAVYRFFKRKEAELLRTSDHIVSLTEIGRERIVEWRGRDVLPPITVIPCCIDNAAFPTIDAARRGKARSALGIAAEARVAVALGSLTGWYRLDRMMAFFAVQRSRDPSSRFLFVTRDPPALIHAAAVKAGVPSEALIIRSARREEVPGLVAAADYGLLFGTEGTSALARSPVKLGEYMALGLPVVTDRVIGDVARIIEESGAGVLVDGFDPEAYAEALDRVRQLRPDKHRWRSSFDRWFSLPEGVRRYASIYEQLAG
jgi:glycosyltransferase involved in cell wall biosynthesis